MIYLILALSMVVYGFIGYIAGGLATAQLIRNAFIAMQVAKKKGNNELLGEVQDRLVKFLNSASNF